MDLASPDTALSPAVKHLICDVGCEGKLPFGNAESEHQHEQSETESGHTNSNNSSQHGPFVLSHGGLDLQCIASVLPASEDTAQYFQEAVRVLAPVFAQCESLMSELSTEQIELTLMPRLLWTQSQKIFHDCLTLLGEQRENNARNVLVLLLVSAVLERALGNVYLLKGGQCPSMLKDLLVTEELDTVLGPSMMQILRAVIGPPTSLNLRNVAWHGFLGDQELPRRYCCFLVLLAASIGDILTGKGLHAVPQRPFVVWTPAVKTRLAAALQMSESSGVAPDPRSLKELLEDCQVIQPHTRDQWHLLLHLYAQGSYGYCLALLLPLLEHVVRRAFAAVNRCPHRVLTAQSSAFYTTFSEMLDQKLPDGSPNQLPAFLTTPCMDLLHDVLFYPEGPRVRDRLSHGEVEFGSVDETMVAPFLHVAVFVALRLHAGAWVTESEDFQMMERRVQSYTSVFHPVAILQYKFASLLRHLENMESSTLESIHQALLGENEERKDGSEDNPLLRTAQHRVTSLGQWQPFSAVFEGSIPSTRNGLSPQLDVLKRISHQHIPTLFRWQQMQQTLQQRHQQLLAKRLRSRQRDNLKRLLLCTPCLQVLVGSVAALIGWAVQRVNDYSSLTAQQGKRLQRFLKVTLQQCENLRTLTSPDKNKWTDSVELLLQWTPSCHQFLLDWHQ
ncbi:hypothetical protein ACOMHN_035170 [Nucella lapillus]